ncbi:MAG: rhodanese-related sulfurtransferase [Gammaproteobacteria bacterium]|nr:rhodanese-related sulfurtransferase [Gammaproteobacteria bacterium]MDH3805983.1 rhodanese-related sulfurtransferase [Gammaproteobacteria bacterium]
MKVVSFYRFLDLAGPEEFGDDLQTICDAQDLLGTILVAAEGFNATIAGPEDSIRAVLAWIERRLSLRDAIEGRWTEAVEAPFRRMRVRLKKEIVTLGRPDILPHERTGTYVPPEQWNALLADPDVVVIDTRNHYEVEVGTFPRALDPQTDSFRQFPEFAKELAETSKDRPLAMFCTGGIRCEKATALMLELGFEEVYHLQGGILKYLEDMPPEHNRWNGECFVFDTRVAVDRDLAEGGYVQCHACRRPLSTKDLASPDYREGVSCPNCINDLDEDREARLQERQRQVELARQRGDTHIGPK